MLTQADREEYRQRLWALMKRIKGDLGELRDEALRATGGEASGGLSDVPLHLGDLGAHEFEEEVNLSLIGNEETIYAECDAALARIEQGAFGRCEACGHDIAKERLHALPYVRYCARCAKQREA
jgi:RNA polymerase-binding transcription factor DksA